jgi:UDP-N-acetylmuramate dehydrogenase
MIPAGPQRQTAHIFGERPRLSDYTTFRIGGPCEQLITCATSAELANVVRELQERKRPFELIGGGSNLLVSDDGWPGVVVRYANPAAEIQAEGDRLVVSGAAALDALAEWAAENGWAGLEFATGIPGSVGGAVAGNAGAFGRQMSDVVEFARLMRRDGAVHEASRAQLGFGYRRSNLQVSGEIVMSVVLRLQRGDKAQLREERQRILKLRRERHPDWRAQPTAGSFFKNIEPTSAADRRQAAGWFLEQAGAKAMRVGRARVFEKHANIIVADPGATACEVLELARKMAQAVWEKFRLKLEPEVRLLGAFPPELQFWNREPRSMRLRGVDYNNEPT